MLVAGPASVSYPKMTTKADCWFFLNNRCTKGEKCEFRHYEPARFATSDCLYWLSGECAKTDCPFWHPQKSNFAAAKGGPTSLKRTPCYYFSIGACRNGDECAFVHDSRLVSQKVHAGELQVDDKMLSPPPEAGKQCVQKQSLQVSTASRAGNAVGQAFRHEKVTSEGQQLDSRGAVVHGPATTKTRPSTGISPASKSVQPTLFSNTQEVNSGKSAPRIAKLGGPHGHRPVGGSRQVKEAELEDGEVRTVNAKIDTSMQNSGRKRNLRIAGLTSSHMSRREGAAKKERPEAPHLAVSSPAVEEAWKSGTEKEVHSSKGARQTIAISMKLREERFQSGKENSTSKLQARLGPSGSKIGLKTAAVAHSKDPKMSGGATAQDRRRLIGGSNSTAKPAFEVKSFEDIIKEKRQKEDKTALKPHIKSEKGVGLGVLGGIAYGAAEQPCGTGNGTKLLAGQKRSIPMTDAKESLAKAKTAGDDFKVLSFEEIMAAKKKKTNPRGDDKGVDGSEEGRRTALNMGGKGIYVPPVNAGKHSSDCLQDQRLDSKSGRGTTGLVKKTASVAAQRKTSALNVDSSQEMAVLTSTPLPKAVSVERLEQPSSQSDGSAACERAVSVEEEKSSADVFHNAGVALVEPALPSQFDDDFDKEIAEFEALLGS